MLQRSSSCCFKLLQINFPFASLFFIIFRILLALEMLRDAFEEKNSLIHNIINWFHITRKGFIIRWSSPRVQISFCTGPFLCKPRRAHESFECLFRRFCCGRSARMEEKLIKNSIISRHVTAYLRYGLPQDLLVLFLRDVLLIVMWT